MYCLHFGASGGLNYFQSAIVSVVISIRFWICVQLLIRESDEANAIVTSIRKRLRNTQSLGNKRHENRAFVRGLKLKKRF